LSKSFLDVIDTTIENGRSLLERAALSDQSLQIPVVRLRPRHFRRAHNSSPHRDALPSTSYSISKKEASPPLEGVD
jgi:hypothetical protein